MKDASDTRRADADGPRRDARRRGPRSPGDDTRGAVLAAARARFAEHGYEGAKLRDVAGDAGVDVALVSYFFGSKDGLFAAAMALPVNPAQIAEELTREGADGLGERLVRAYLALLEDPEAGGPVVAMVRSAATHDRAAALLRGYLQRELLGRIARAIDSPPPAPELRATLAGSQMVGLIMARYVVRVEPIASADTETLVAAIAPTLQRYLTGDLSAGPARPGPRRP